MDSVKEIVLYQFHSVTEIVHLDFSKASRKYYFRNIGVRQRNSTLQNIRRQGNSTYIKYVTVREIVLYQFHSVTEIVHLDFSKASRK